MPVCHRRRIPALLLFLGCSLGVTSAEIRLPKMISDHSVLQRQVPIHIWGWSSPNEQLTITIHDQSRATIANEYGEWSIWLQPEQAGGPYTLTVDGPEKAKVEDVLIGDVWICSGQSNMEFGIGNLANPQEEIAKADNPKIRLFTVPKKVSAEPLETISTQWETCTPENIKHGAWNGFSAVGYFFGKHLQETEHVPIGLIHTSWGGTIAQAWTSRPR